MSNILIIKHGSLGDIIQANGAIKDIKKNFSDQKVLLLTTPPYANFMSSCPYIDGVLIDVESLWSYPDITFNKLALSATSFVMGPI